MKAEAKPRRFLVPTKIATGEPVPEDEWIEVTGKSEGIVEKTMRGLLINMSDEWFVDDVTTAERRP